MKKNSDIEILTEALQRISKARPDRLDHSVDILIIERMVDVANRALDRLSTKTAPLVVDQKIANIAAGYPYGR